MRWNFRVHLRYLEQVGAAWSAATLVILLVVVDTDPIPVRANSADPSTWSKAPRMLEEHVGHTATLLPDGRVLLAGGTNNQGAATSACELFDPKASRWVRAASMIVPRAAHTATLLLNGDVVVVGGQTGLNVFPVDTLASAEVYHPGSNRWTPLAAMHAPRARHQAVRLRDGRVLIVGGAIREPPGAPPPAPELEQAEIYDPGRDRWSLFGAGLPLVTEQASTLMRNGTVLVTGGATDVGFATSGAELFDPATNRWHSTTWPMATPRYGHTATLLPDGKVLLVGGYTTQRQTVGGLIYPNSELLTTSEIFDLRGNTEVRVGYSKVLRLEHTATLLRNGLVLVVGSAYASNADSQLLDPANSEEWLSTGLRMDRYLHTATLLADGRVLIAGGFGVGSPRTAWIFSPVSGAGESSSLGGVVMQVAVILLLFGLAAFGFAVASGRFNLRRQRTGREADSEWIDS